MRRLSPRSERGVTSVVVALLLVSLLGFAAIAIDVGSLWWDRKQAQNGADAAALAIAQACAEGNCGTPNTTAQDYATKNKYGPQAYTGSAVADTGAGRVTATVSTDQVHWFAPILGITSTTVSARAVAVWGTPTMGSTLPLAISECWFFYQTGSTSGAPPPTGTHFVIPLKSKQNSTPDGALTCGSQAAHNEAAGGFGWLTQTSTCQTDIDLTNPWVASDPGNSARDCSALEINVGDTVLMPIFDQWRGSGNNAEYRIKSFAAFVITDYCFGPGMAQTTGWPACKNLPVMTADKGPNISGTFVRIVEIGELLSGTGGINMGAQFVRLVE